MWSLLMKALLNKLVQLLGVNRSQLLLGVAP
jgi:hypothetical protein